MAGNSEAVAYSVRWELIDLAEQGATNVLQAAVYKADDENATATSATVAIYGSDKGTVLAETAATIDGDGVPTYSWATPSDQELRDDYYVVWSIVIDGITITARNGLAVVLRRLYNPVTDADINQVAKNLDPDEAYSPSATANHELARREVWNQCQLRLIEAGRRPWLIVDPPSLRTWVLNATIAHIYRAYAQTQNDYLIQAEMYDRMAEVAFSRIQLKFAEPEGEVHSRRRRARPTAWLM